MLKIIIGALVPTAFTMLLGYLAARHHRFGPKDATVLNRMVMTYALPLSIFVGMVSNSRTALLEDVVVLIALLVAIVGVYGFVYVLCRRLFRLSVGASALGALAAFHAQCNFYGPPCPRLSLSHGRRRSGYARQHRSPNHRRSTDGVSPFSGDKPESAAAKQGIRTVGAGRNARKSVAHLRAAARLVCLSRLCLRLERPAYASIDHGLAGSAWTRDNWGRPLLFGGYPRRLCREYECPCALLRSLSKNIAQPALVLGCLLLLGYSKPLLGEAVVTTAMPAAAILPMFAVQYDVAVRTLPSALLLSTLASVLTLSGFIALTSG